MNFIDRVTIEVSAGDGGDGLVSFRHEKFIDKGGPDGGDGGNGGSVIFEASRNQNTLAKLRFQKRLEATPGGAGGKRKMHGKNGDDLVVAVPVGTIVSHEDGKTMIDLTEDGQRAVIAKGGDGGYGNTHFTSSRRQAPRISEKGEEGEKFVVALELKTIADVGLVGLPNAGKSTFLASVSNAKPAVADYPFTTLIPNLGMVDIHEVGFLFADIPGLIEGASQGKGLGDEFLRHIERTSVLVHLIDVYQDDVVASYAMIQDELKAYKVDLTVRPQLVVLNKIEGLDEDTLREKERSLRRAVPKGTQIFKISAKSKIGIPQLLAAIKKVVQEEREKHAGDNKEEVVPVLTLKEEVKNSWEVERVGKKFLVTGPRIEKFARRTRFGEFHGEQRLRDIMRKMGIFRELTKQGVMPGDKIAIGSVTHPIGVIEY